MAKQKNKILLAKEQAEREIEDAKLLEYRDMINFGGDPLKELMSSFYIMGRSVTGIENINNIRDILMEYKATGNIKLSTPITVTYLTKTLRLIKEIIGDDNIIDIDKSSDFKKMLYANSGRYKRNLRLKSEVDELTGKFIYEIMKMFDRISGIMNAVTFNYDANRSFNDIIYQARKERLINGIEYNSLKLFNSIRNLFAHNVGVSAMVSISANDDMLLKIKAILLEVNINVYDILVRHKERLEVYLISLIKANKESGMLNPLGYAYNDEEYEELKLFVRSLEETNNYKTNCLERIKDARTNLM